MDFPAVHSAEQNLFMDRRSSSQSFQGVYNFLTTKQPILSSVLRIRAVQDRLEDHDGQATQNNTGYLLYGLLIPKCAVVS